VKMIMLARPGCDAETEPITVRRAAAHALIRINVAFQNGHGGKNLCTDDLVSACISQA
jgi:hypothetical protein